MKSWKKIWSIGTASLSLLIAVPGLTSASDTEWLNQPKLYEVHTWAGKAEWGHDNGKADVATFFHPHSIATLPDGKLLIADSGNHLLRILSADQVSAYSGLDIGEDEAGLPKGAFNDDVKEKAAFNLPAGITLDNQGNVIVADSGNHAIRKIDKAGNVTTIAGSGLVGNKDGKGKEATFNSPSDVAADAKGNIFVADTLNHVIRKIASDGTVTTLTAPSTRVIEYFPGAVEDAGDFADGAIFAAKFNEPSGLVIDGKGNLYVSDRGNNRIRYIDFASGKVTTIAGGGTYTAQAAYTEGDYIDGAASSARFNAPEGLTLLSDGTLLVADSLNHAIRIVNKGQVSTFAGVGTEFGQSDGVTSYAQFNHPTDVTLLSDGRVVVADEYGNKIRVTSKYAKPVNLPTGKNIAILLNGTAVQSDVPAQLKSGSTFLPLRSVVTALGYKVENGKSGNAITATLTKGEMVYKVTNGSKVVTKTVKGVSETLTLSAAPYIVNSRLFLPVRFFTEEGNLDIQWDAAARIVVIRDKTFA